MKKVELYLIGERIKRSTILIFIFFSIIFGLLLVLFTNSIIIGICSSIMFLITILMITRKDYWIVSNNGVYTPTSYGVIRYLVIIIKYALLGNDTDDLIFINYKTIKYINLIDKLDGLGIQIISTNNKLISITINKNIFNQDLLNSIGYIQKKGVKIHNLEYLDKIEINKNKGIRIEKNKL